MSLFGFDMFGGLFGRADPLANMHPQRVFGAQPSLGDEERRKCIASLELAQENQRIRDAQWRFAFGEWP